MMRLVPGQIYITENSTDAFKITSGSLDVFVVPFEGGVQGRPRFLMHLEEGDTIPSLNHTDQDHVEWAFRFESREDCEIQIVDGGATRPLRKRLCRKLGIEESGERNALEEAIRERYVTGLVHDDVLITRSEQQREKEKEEAEEIIRSAGNLDLPEAAGEDNGPGKDAGPGKAPRRRELPCSREHLPALVAFSICGIMMGSALILSIGRGLSPILILAIALVYIVLLWIADRRKSIWAERTAESEQSAIIEELYRGPGSGGAKVDLQELAIRSLTNYDECRRNELLGYDGVMAMILAAGLFVADLVLFPIPTLIMAVAVILSGILVYRADRRAGHHEMKARAARSKGNAGLVESISRIEKVRLSGAVEHVIRKYYLRKREEDQRDRAKVRVKVAGNTGAILTLSTGAIAAMGIIVFGIFGKTYDTDSQIAFMIGCGLASWQAMQGVRCINGRKERKHIREEIGSREDGGDHESLPKSDKEEPETIAGGEPILEVDHIVFGYDHREMIKDISLTITKGEHIGITGPSGSGKTTLMKLMSGALRPDKGRVSFAGRQIDSESAEVLRSVSGIVTQGDQLLTASIGENLFPGDRVADRSEAARVLKDIGLDKEIEQMPMGMNTLIREDGENISAGQKQKLLIARALIRDPRILFFDEAESELSVQDQELIREAVLKRELTWITVSHQYHTISKCDKIIVIKRGEIVESGSPEELTEKKGHFYKLMYRQM